jgi:hypothetical protein
VTVTAGGTSTSTEIVATSRSIGTRTVYRSAIPDGSDEGRSHDQNLILSPN